MIDKSIEIENLIDMIPGAVNYLSEKGIKCIACGEPIWGTLKNVSEKKGFSKSDIDQFVNDLNNMIDKS